MTHPDAPQPRHAQSYWLTPSRSLTGGCLLLAGIGLLMYMVGRLGHPHYVEFASLLWIPAVIATSLGAGWVFQRPTATTHRGQEHTAPAPAPLEQSPPPGPQVVLGGGDIDRIRQLLSGKFPFELLDSAVHYDDTTGRLMSYALRAIVPGYLADRRNATMVAQRLQGAVAGDWLVDVDSARDQVTVTRKKPFPPWVAPPLPEVIIDSPEEAIRRYDKFTIGIGVDELGERLEYALKDYHHWLIIGGTGSGKSVFVRGIIEQLRAGGIPILAGDGKGTDYTSLNGEAQMVMISSSPAEHPRLVHAAVQELSRRRRVAQERKAAGHPDPMGFPAWAIILDEFATMRNEVAGLYEEHPGKDNAFVEDLRVMFKVGREFRMHMMLSTQDLYARTIPRDILGQCKLIITLGPPSDMTLKQAFTQEMEPKARRVGELISPESQGRGLVAVPETASVKEFQSYWSYTPGTDIDGPKVPEGIRGLWRTYRDNVSRKIPKLYSRQWFCVEDPEFASLPMAELHALKMVNLDLDDGTPDPQMFQYDKSRDDYNGHLRGSDHDGALRELKRPTVQPSPAPSDLPAVSGENCQPM
ncbi:DNA segregation ATPase, FtsK/SpoIIIE family (plasmid) [Mycobacterium sp. JS623]|uniref:FtsK/SpoIIIE domain-containing protein n=1 Tax=Mycobacterium sp. JS623 TaxID=212767 RepID=UPI0002A59BDE|nr:FtsK/SpoIIIE domain-containing protein [Mycobacterium sp. JS623]AGB26995.1 DNA segregation ATPase, FtsK/SpoIIIE family [Mycobacterium sp. JS623]